YSGHAERTTITPTIVTARFIALPLRRLRSDCPPVRRKTGTRGSGFFPGITVHLSRRGRRVPSRDVCHGLLASRARRAHAWTVLWRLLHCLRASSGTRFRSHEAEPPRHPRANRDTGSAAKTARLGGLQGCCHRAIAAGTSTALARRLPFR